MAISEALTSGQVSEATALRATLATAESGTLRRVLAVLDVSDPTRTEPAEAADAAD